MARIPGFAAQRLPTGLPTDPGLIPQIPKLVEKAKHAQDSMDKLNDKAGSALDQVQTNVSKGANKASEQIVPLAQDASNQINSVRPSQDSALSRVDAQAPMLSMLCSGWAGSGLGQQGE